MILTQGQRKVTASVFIGAGILLIIPGIGDAFFNIPIAEYIVSKTNYTFVTSLILTYTLLPIILIWIGSLIYPRFKAKTIIRHHHQKLSGEIKEYLSNLMKDRNTQLLTIIILMIVYNILQVKFGH